MKGKIISTNNSEVVLKFNDNIIKLQRRNIKTIRISDDLDNKNDVNSDKFEPYSAGAAAWMSVFPVWSGSFRTGYNPGGLTFVLLKSPTFITSYVFLFLDVNENNKSKGFMNINSSNYNHKWRKACFISFGAWFLLTIGDMIFSGLWIKKYNDEHMYGLINFKDNISLDLSMSKGIENDNRLFSDYDNYYISLALRF